MLGSSREASRAVRRVVDRRVRGRGRPARRPLLAADRGHRRAPATTPRSGATSSPSGRSSSPGDRTVLLVNRRGGEVLGRADLPLRAGRGRGPRPQRRPGRGVRAGRRASWPSVTDAVAAGARAIVGDHRRTLRGGCRGRPARGRGAGDRTRRRCGAGRSQLPRRRRHHDRPPAGARRPPRRRRGRAQPERQPGPRPRRPPGRPRAGRVPLRLARQPGGPGARRLPARLRRPRRDAGRRRLHRGRRRRARLPRRRPRTAGRGQAAGPAGPRSHRGGGAQRGLPHRLAHQLLDGRRRRVRGGRGRTGWTTRPSWPTCCVALRAPRRMPGRRVAILTDGGGHGAVAADALAAASGLRGPGADRRSSPASSRRRCGPRRRSPTRSTSPARASRTSRATPGASATLLASDQVDGVLLTGYFGGYSTEQSNLTEAGAGRGPRRWPTPSRPRTSRSSCRRSTRTARPARCCGPRAVPVHRDVDRACAVLAGLVEHPADGLGEALPARGAAGHRHVVRRRAGAVRRGRCRLPGRGVGRRRAPGSRPRSPPVGLPGRPQGDRPPAQVRGRRGRRRPRRPGRGAGGVRRPGRAGWRRRRSPSRPWPTSPTASS